MAINLTVALNDAEQARIVATAAKVAPGMSGPELKEWAEGFMKNSLREKVREVALEAEREAANAAIRSAEQALEADWA